jgi:molybdate-binding protein/DNA-binding transcriptional regulator YhcF (GntR family)
LTLEQFIVTLIIIQAKKDIMSSIIIDQTANLPIYQQIVDQVRQQIATKTLRPGDHLPTIRKLAEALDLNPGTVMRAYRELEREGTVVTKHGGGTIVSIPADDPRLAIVRRSRLSNMVNSNIIQALSLGYSPEELDAAFQAHLSRWREERRSPIVSLRPSTTNTADTGTILIVGSHDLILNMLVTKLKEGKPELNIEVTYAGSLGGLIALQENRAHLAGIHLLDEETGEYNYPYIRHVLPGREVAIIHLAYRIQGLMFAKTNPKQIQGIEDLRRREITFVNRQKGSGTRVLLDLELRKCGILPVDVNGYENELDTHVAVATSIARGEADCGLGIQGAASACDLGFVPLLRERYDLVIPDEHFRSALLFPLINMISSSEFRNTISHIEGYDSAQIGTTTFCR